MLATRPARGQLATTGGWMGVFATIFPIISVTIVWVAFAEFLRWPTEVEGCQQRTGEFGQKQCALER